MIHLLSSSVPGADTRALVGGVGSTIGHGLQDQVNPVVIRKFGK